MSATTSKIASAFPKALTNGELVEKIAKSMAGHGFGGYGSSTLLATSICCDEICRPLEDDMVKAFGPQYFSMGGLAGFPFGGITSFGAMAAHIPDGGNCLLVYGPHVGVDSSGAVGTVERRGRAHGGACCGSACAACAYVKAVAEGGEIAAMPEEATDAQQYFVGKMLLPFSDKLTAADETMVELPYSVFAAQDKMINDIVGAASGAVGGEGKIGLVGGIQINTPEGLSDYFLPMRMEVRSNSNEVLADLM
jgi:hypothetical protein